MALDLRSRLAQAIMPKPSLAVIEEAKAATGIGAAMVEFGVPLTERTDTARWLRTAQKISHVGWPAVAERIVSGRASSVAWHLEDDNGDTIDDQSPPPYQAVRDLLAKPMGADLTKRSEGGVRLTQRHLWRLTLRHMGVVNVGFWFLSQRDLLGGTPLEILYINPSRMTPATDARGNLIGWVLDADESYTFQAGRIKGIPLELDEVIPFWLEPPDWGYYGVGLVEMAMRKIRLGDAGDTFLTHTFATGGRRGAFITPKEGRMDNDVFDALVSGLRNVAESPDSAKRNIVSKGPLEVTPQASTPDELQVYEIVGMNRDDTLGMWGVPLSQTGIPAAAGLNSGEVRKYDEAALWQNAIHPRLDAFRETVQFYLLDRFEALGVTVRLVLDEPSFDDEAPKYDIAEKARVIPLMDNERRAITGHDPLPEYDEVDGTPLGVAIRLPKDIVLAAIGPGEEKRPPQRAPEPPETPVDEAAEDLLEDGEVETVAKAGLGIRDDIERDVTPDLRRKVAEFLTAQRSSVLNRLAERAGHLMKRPSDVDAWWSPRRWDLALAELLAVPQDRIAVQVAQAARERVSGSRGKAEDDFLDDATQFVRARAGERITGINATTRKAVEAALRDVLEEAVDEGWSPDEVADALQDRIGGLPVWNEARSELVARTETMFAYNDAALHSYRSMDVGQVEALDGDYDETCRDRDGKVFSVEEALGIADHPNGTLDWAPVLAGKAVRVPRPPARYRVPETIVPQILVNVAAPPAPEVHVTVPPTLVNVEPSPAPQVTVNVPEPPEPKAPVVIVQPAAKADGPLDVRIVDDIRPPKVKRVVRDAQGRVDGVIEGRP